MANPTTNYGFVLPTPTDLVTDLPADFDVALQGVDTQLKALQPGTTLGDLAYSSATANTNTRLGIGTAGQVLAVSGGVPAWTTTADVTPLTTKGDLFTFTTVDARLAVGSNNLVLMADSAQATGLKYGGSFTAYTPTLTNLTIGNGTVSAQFMRVGSMVDLYIFVQLGTTSSVTGAITVSLPVTGAGGSGNTGYPGVEFADNGVAFYYGQAFFNGGGTAFDLQPYNSSTTYLTRSGTSATVPFTWGNTDYFVVQLSYMV